MAPSEGRAGHLLIRAAVILLLHIQTCQSAQAAKNRYVMDVPSDCVSVGIQDVSRGQTIVINARSPSPLANTQLSCKLQFSPKTNGDTLKMSFSREVTAIIVNCEASLTLTMKDKSAINVRQGFSQNFQMGCYTKPNDIPSMEARDGHLIINFVRPSFSITDYTFRILVEAERSVADTGGSDSGSDLSVGALVGIIVGVIALVILFCIFCVCCYMRSKKSDKIQETSKEPAMNYENKNLQNGVGGSSVEESPSSDRRLLVRNENNANPQGKSALDRFGPVEPRKSRKPVDDYEDFDVEAGGSQRSRDDQPQRSRDNQPQRSQDRPPQRSRDGPPQRSRDGPPQRSNGREEEENVRRSPLLSDLHRNPKFRRSFHDNEVDSQDRANRISYTSENSTESFNSRGVPLPKPLPPVPKSPPRSPSPHRRGEKIAMISRDLPLSSNYEVARKLEGDGTPDESSDDDRQRSKKHDTRHTLRPDRRGRQSRRDEDEEDSEEERRRRRKERERRDRERQEEEEEEERRRRRKREERRRREEEEDERREGRFKKSASGRKSKGKGPRKSRSRSTGNALSDMEDNYQRSRSKSPSSVRSLNFIEDDDDDDDLDSTYTPFKRSSSKTSLYASRSSLYGRRRKNSMGETMSLSSYAHDDADSRFGDFDKKGLSRREKDRLFKSTGELEMHTATAQVVRECATQTGSDRAVYIYGRKTIAKARPGRMYSRGSQTGVGRERRDSTGSARSGRSGRSSKSNSRLKHKSRSQESLRKMRRSRSRNLNESDDDSDDRRSQKSRSRSRDLDYTDDDDDRESRRGRRKRHRSKSRGLDDEDDDDDRQSSRGGKAKPRARPRKSTGAASVDLSDSDAASDGGRSAAASSIAASMAHPPPQANPYGAHFVPMAYPTGPVTFLPTAPGGPPVVPYVSAPGVVKPPVAPKPAVAPKPQKSKWETLVEMTDGEKQRQRQDRDYPTETESMLSSMYTPSVIDPNAGKIYAPPSYTTAQRYPHPNVTLSSNYPSSSGVPLSARGPRDYKLDSSYQPSESII